MPGHHRLVALVLVRLVAFAGFIGVVFIIVGRVFVIAIFEMTTFDRGYVVFFGGVDFLEPVVVVKSSW